MATSKQICIDGGHFKLTDGKVYEISRRASWKGDEYVTVVKTDDGQEGDFLASRFRPLTRQEEATEVRRAQAAMQSDAVPSGAPDGNPKTRFGMAKPPLALIPGPALVHIADAFRDGAGKYGPANWRIDPVTTSTYVNAALRHILAYYDGEQTAEDSGVHHLGHAAGCLAILLDAEEQGTLNDDRPTAGRTSALIKEKTRPLA